MLYRPTHEYDALICVFCEINTGLSVNVSYTTVKYNSRKREMLMVVSSPMRMTLNFDMMMLSLYTS